MRSSSSKDTLGSFEQQMLTPQEISNRRRSRRLLERKGIALEEAVERRVCELVHGHLWRHASALDEVRDEKLRSRTAALALVGISLQDLGISFGHQPSETENLQIEGWISKARHGLIMMNDAKHPSGKLQQLKGAHKAIVEFLSEFHQSSSSADEILPTLIYTLITSPPEGINVVSNLNYIQRFRAASRVDGEAAYCLTNLEAAITFLETVDLASLRSEESLEGPPKSSSRPSTPSPMRDLAEQPTLDHPLQTPNLPKVSQPTSPTHQRKLSNPFQPPTTALGAANDAVRTTADQGFKTIGNTLDNSFKLLFGRLKEQKVVREGADANGTSILPKTLDDVARLIDEGYKVDDEDESNVPSTCGPLSDQVDEYNAGSVKADKSLNTAFAGRSRDRSVDSVQSGGSGTRVVFANTSTSDGGRLTESHATAQVMSNQDRSLQHLGNSTVDSMRNFGNSLNPLKGFGGLSVMRGFGRSPSSGTPTLSTSEKPPQEPQHGPTDNKDSTNVKVTFPKTLRPPVQRYLDVKSAEDLRIGEVAELVNDYRRLADALKEFGAFQ